MNIPARRLVPSIVTALVMTIALAAPVVVTDAAAEAAAPDWAPADTATIHPGVQTYTDGAQCTANFVFHDATDIYIGQAAHCSGTGGQTDTNGCDAGSLPIGTPVEVQGASQPGTLVYNSWLTMRSVDEDDVNACSYNDFALIRLHPDDHASVNPSLPVIGGPVAVNTDGSPAGEYVHTYGNSSLRLGLTALSPKFGISLGTTGEGWTHPHYAVTPGVPGDSGSAILDDEGNALGVLSTLAIAPLAASNNASDLHRSVQYMLDNGGPQVQLALGTEPFTPVFG